MTLPRLAFAGSFLLFVGLLLMFYSVMSLFVAITEEVDIWPAWVFIFLLSFTSGLSILFGLDLLVRTMGGGCE